MKRLPPFILIVFLIATSCAPADEVQEISPTSTITVTSQPTSTPTETATPSIEPTPTQNHAELLAEAEAQYAATLNEEQLKIFQESADVTLEGITLTKRFMSLGENTEYLAYYDSDGKVAYIWNTEQGKINPALMIDESFLFLNGTTPNLIELNPVLDAAESEKEMADFRRYALANTIAISQGVDLLPPLESALADPRAIKFLEEGRNVTLFHTNRIYTDMDGVKKRFDVPNQTIYIDGNTPIVFRTVNDLDPNTMIIAGGTTDGKRWIRGYGFEQNQDGVLFINYYSAGPEDLASHKKYANLVLARRLAFSFGALFGRAERTLAVGAEDPIIQTVIYSGMGHTVIPLIVYSQPK